MYAAAGTCCPSDSIPSTHHRAASRMFANALFGAGCGEIQRSAVYAPRTTEFDNTIALPMFRSRMIGRLPSRPADPFGLGSTVELVDQRLRRSEVPHGVAAGGPGSRLHG